MTMLLIDGATLYAGRLNAQGDVRLLQFSGTPVSPPEVTDTFDPGDIAFDVTIPHAQWPAVVAHVSKRGDIEGRHFLIAAFHQNEEPFAQAAGLMAAGLTP